MTWVDENTGTSNGFLSIYCINANKVIAVGGYGNILLNTTSMTQNINFNPIADATYGDPDIPLYATASSGYPVTFSTSNTVIAEILNNKIHILKAGTVDIYANQSGDTVYVPAPRMIQPFVIHKANQLINFDPLTKATVGDSDIVLKAIATSELPVSYASSDNSIASVFKDKIHILKPGTITITASQAGNENFNAAQDVVQVLEIDTVTGIGLFVRTKFFVYYNPGNDLLAIRMPEISNINETFALIFNLQGQLLLKQNIYEKENVINTGGIAKGLYILKVCNKDQLFVIKFVKE